MIMFIITWIVKETPRAGDEMGEGEESLRWAKPASQVMAQYGV
jgi:hypothetical protein